MNPEQEISNGTEQKNSSDLNTEGGRYIYCMIATGEERRFDLPAIGGRGNEIYSISYQDIAAVVSASPVIKYPISRENTMAHQKVLEELMGDFTVLPVKFGTIAAGKDEVNPSERIREEVLKVRYKELKDLLLRMDGKIELGIKAFWNDMEVIFREIVDENGRIRRLREKLFSKPAIQPLGEKTTLGEMVKNALESKKAKEEKDIMDVFKKVCVDQRSNKVFGDQMITNAAFLVEGSRVEEFDGLVNKLAAAYDGRARFKYVGPLPPINFVELVIVLKGE